MEFPHDSILPLVENSRLFEELLGLDSAVFRRVLGRARAWLLWPGDEWELPEAERRSAYAVLRGKLELVETDDRPPTTEDRPPTRAPAALWRGGGGLGATAVGPDDAPPVTPGDEQSTVTEGQPLTSHDVRPDAPQASRYAPESGCAVVTGQVFGQWTGLRRCPLDVRVVVVEPTALLECDEELLAVALGPVASRFKQEFYRPLVLASGAFPGITAEALESPIRSSRLAFHPPASALVREGEYGSTMFFVLKGRAQVDVPAVAGPSATPPIVLEQGQFFGELSAISFQPRTATVVAAEDCLVMECDRLVMNDLRKRSPQLKEQINASYRERAFVAQISRSELLRDVGVEALAFIQRTATLEDYEPYEPIFVQGDPADALYLIQNGTVNVTQETETGPVAVAQLRPGDVFGEGALLIGAGEEGEAAFSLATLNRYLAPLGRRAQTVTALQHVDLVRLPKEAFDAMMATFPAVAERLRNTLRERQMQNMARGQSSRSRSALRWMMDRQLTPGNHVLAIDMSSCIRCGNCVEACEQTHDDGISRFFWDHLRGNEELLPRVRVSSSCQHCEFALCARVCPTNAIERDPLSGSVFIDYDRCIKCGRCGNPEQGCPYGSIQIVPAAEVRARGSEGARGRGGEEARIEGGQGGLTHLLSRLFAPSRSRALAPSPSEASPPARSGKNYPVKCDLCYGKPYEACVHHCPTGAVFRFDGQEYLEDRLERLSEPVRARRDEIWWLWFRAAFRAPPKAKRPGVLELTLGESKGGVPVSFYRPEAGVEGMTVNVFLKAPGITIGGGPTRQLKIPAFAPETGGIVGAAEYQMTAPVPGPRTLQLSLYQGGFYIATVPIEVEFAEPPAKERSSDGNA